MNPTSSSSSSTLRPDCSQCFALCCTALGFTRSADFAIDKPAATPCPNLGADFGCTIHRRLRPRGFSGCTVFDCFGAGQAVSQGLFNGISWRANPDLAADMFAAFKVLRQLHEMLWLLAQAGAKAYGPAAADDVRRLQAEVRRVAEGRLEDILMTDAGSLHHRVGAVLREVSEEVRAGYFGAADPDADPRFARLAPGADLAGANLRGLLLCGADLRGACLIAADLRGADLMAVDLLGADLRDARLDGANLTGALFLTQAQITAARGSASTLLPVELGRPGHWTSRPGPGTAGTLGT